MNPVDMFLQYSPKIPSNIIFPYTPRSFVWSLPFRFSDKNVVMYNVTEAGKDLD